MIKDSKTVFRTVFSAFNKAATALDPAPYEFHLTGSRCFGYENAESDWDFFVQVPNSTTGLAALRQWLADSGFQKESNDNYIARPVDSVAAPFNDTLEVWIHQVAKIHIQIVRDAASKLEIQEAMKRVPGMEQMLKSLSKGDRKAIWKMGRAIFDAGQRNGWKDSRRTGTAGTGWG